MTAPSLPLLAGQGWSVHKRPTFATIVASHVSGREVRSPLYVNPIWSFEATYDGLDSSASSYPGLGAGSLQSLMGLFLQCQGTLGTFLYYDPTDYQTVAQAFGTGDGATTGFQLSRTLGGFVEPVGAAFAPSSVGRSPISAAAYAPNNLLSNSIGSNAGLTPYDATITANAADPNGGNQAVLVAETIANAPHNAAQASVAISAGGGYTLSAYLKPGGATMQQLALSNSGSSQPTQAIYAIFDLSTGAVTTTGTAGSTAVLSNAKAVAAGSGYYRCSLSGCLDSVSTVARVEVWGVNGNASAGYAPSYGGATANSYYVAFPQLEQTALPGGPGPFRPTLMTPNYGGPIVTASGALIDPSAYSLANGTITFASAPSAGAPLLWSGMYGFLCRFDDDALDFEQFMANLWKLDSLKFLSVRPQ